MSVSKLTRCFRQVYGVSLHAYVIGARLQKGAELLLNHGITVREVSDAVGYAKPSQFSSEFRKRFGILPGEYRLRG
jgi:AraC-like DNA-binding protein